MRMSLGFWARSRDWRRKVEYLVLETQSVGKRLGGEGLTKDNLRTGVLFFLFIYLLFGNR
jgi:hypothetical protein